MPTEMHGSSLCQNKLLTLAYLAYAIVTNLLHNKLTNGGKLMYCMIIGDILALLIHQAAPQCSISAVSEINSSEYAARYSQEITADITVISLTMNDQHTNLNDLRLIRSRIISGRVVWLLPIQRPKQIDAITEMVCEFGDVMVNTELYIHHNGVLPNAEEARDIANTALGSINRRLVCNA
jgi:hypothetical protein